MEENVSSRRRAVPADMRLILLSGSSERLGEVEVVVGEVVVELGRRGGEGLIASDERFWEGEALVLVDWPFET